MIVYKRKFPLSHEPVSYQISKHVSNLLAYQESNKNAVLIQFKTYLDNPETPSYNFRVNQIVQHYGIDICREWFSLIYGWEFEQIKKRGVK